MGELFDGFGGRQNGELIRASDWDGVLLKIEEMFGTLEASLDTRIDTLEKRATVLEARVADAEGRLDTAEEAIGVVRSRFRRLDLRTTTTRFAIGQRGTITARVTALDGSDLDLSVPSTRPWVDFVTVWGTLKAAPGFTSSGGAGDQTLSVQVNGEGIAQVLIRSAHAEAFTEEEEQEIEGFLATRPQANNLQTMSEMMLVANTPRDGGLNLAYQAISAEYLRPASTPPVFQRYIDTYYVTQPARATGSFTSIFSQRWRDYRATVMAFLKPDASPTTSDGALASASIQVTFRDWIAPWLTLDFLPGVRTLQTDYADRFRNLIDTAFGPSLDNVITEVNDLVRGKGLIGRQRDLLAVDAAIGGMRFDTDPPPFMSDLVQAVQFGSQVQHSMFYSQAVTPGESGAALGFGAIAGSAGQAAAEAGRVQEELRNEIDGKLSASSEQLRNEVQIAQVAFQEELLRDDGPILSVQRDVQAFAGQVRGFETELGKKASVDMISSIIGTMPV